MKVSDYVVNFIKDMGVDTVFGYQGGAITHLVDSLFKIEGIKFISMYHEQAAAFAAEGYSRTKENIGVAIATSGPGATNLITGIGSCYFDSSPCVFITGQVNSYEYKKNNNIRQVGFQETDIVSLVKPITKYAVMVEKAEDIRYILEKGFFLAKNGRKGPVLIDIPMNIQREDIDADKLRRFDKNEVSVKSDSLYLEEKINNCIQLIKSSKRPVLLLGGGIRGSMANKEVLELIKLTKIPVVTTLMALDCYSREYEESVGFMGAYGVRAANLAVANSDLLIVLGSRLTARQTSTDAKSFARKAKVIHVDIDENELNLRVNEDISINCDLKEFIRKIIKKLNEDKVTLDIDLWKNKINDYKRKYKTFNAEVDQKELNPNEVMYAISKDLPSNTIYTLDVGQNQIWAAQSLLIKSDQRVLTSGGMGAMGFSIPVAIGAYFANKNATIIAIVGDGGFQMNIQELQTIVREQIKIKIILINNKTLGMIRHFQEIYFNSKYYGTIEGYDSPDFIKICNAYGIEAIRVSSIEEIENNIKLKEDNNCNLIEVELSKITYVIPKLEMGHPIEEQSPLIDSESFKEDMLIEPYTKSN